MICSRRMLAISFWRFCCFALNVVVDWAKVRNVMKRKQFVITSNETGTNWKQTIVSRFSLTLADSLQLFYKRNEQMDGCCLLNIKWSSAAMIDFELDSLMTLFFFHFLREFVCCLYKVVENRKSRAHIFFFFDLVAAVKKPQNAFASCWVLLRPTGLISFAFFQRRAEWIIFYDAIGFSSSSRCFQLALINELPVRPSVDAE